MGKLFRILGLVLIAAGILGIIGLVFNIGFNPRKIDVVMTYGAVEFILLIGLILQVLYKVTEGEL